MGSGLILLLFSAWFIAASAVAGNGFNYMLPAVVIRALALIRIASGYGQMWLGHQQLLNHLCDIRLNLFRRCINGWLDNSDTGAEALTQHTQAVANIWIAWIAQNAGAIIMLSIGVGSAIWLVPGLSSYAWSLLLVYLLITLWLVIAGLRQTKGLLQAQQRFVEDSEAQLKAATLWPLQKTINLADASSLWRARKKRQFQSDSGVSLLHAVSLGLLVLMIAQLPQHYAGEAVLLVLVMLLLTARDWLAPAITSHPALTDYLHGAEGLEQLKVTTVTKLSCTQPIKTLQLKDFKATNMPVPNVNLRIPDKGIVLIKGSSGTGKSSLLKGICGLLPYEGSRRLNGKDLAQGHVQNWHYSDQTPVCLSATLRDNLCIANQKVSEQELKEVLLMADLPQLQTNLQQWLGPVGRRLSGGELKRLNLARAILTNAELLLLDEPFEGLAVTQQNKMALTINHLAAGRPVVVATHIIPKDLDVTAVLELEEEL
ncbi:hypothetical protein AT746_05995 [Lacimicrobium alkaliphilum]|uniref:ABC transporter domain-containing protein n=2 Tax=Lacimicrobium alkaliphilum TaxID=1526571 RepID=A0A0U2RKR2_9ALTE|nr:hypothetical protein AT746_05995 [Lacimicrobium alkaliphilum]